MISSAFINRNAAGLPPTRSKVTKVPPDPICAIASACCGWLASSGKITLLMRASPSSASATLRAEAAIARQRRSKVTMPFSISQALKGEIEPPVCFI